MNLAKKLFFVVAGMAGLAGSAQAADLPAPPPLAPPVYAPPPFNWTGFYIGGNVGGAWSSTTLTDKLTGANVTGNSGGWLGGGQVGLNYQDGRFVLGFEGTGDWTSLNSTSGVVPTAFGSLQDSAKTKWVATAAVRMGIAVDHFLVYGKGGAGFVGNNVTVANVTTGAGASSSNTNYGWLLGGGVEYAFSNYWSVKLEYDYLRLNGWTAASPFVADNLNVKQQVNMVMAGFNYRFCTYCQ
jgi:outer membrane immunogenic protein